MRTLTRIDEAKSFHRKILASLARFLNKGSVREAEELIAGVELLWLRVELGYARLYLRNGFPCILSEADCTLVSSWLESYTDFRKKPKHQPVASTGWIDGPGRLRWKLNSFFGPIAPASARRAA